MKTQTGWTLESGVEFIRRYQDLAVGHGYNLSLGGGVLNKGGSDHDLDIVCVPRKDRCPSMSHFADGMRDSIERGAELLSFTWARQWNQCTTVFKSKLSDGRSIDWFVVKLAV